MLISYIDREDKMNGLEESLIAVLLLKQNTLISKGGIR